MTPEAVEVLRQRWRSLRIYRYRGSFPVAYRILRNYIRIEAKREHPDEA
ncbi:YlcG family protein [Salmonella enterica]|nr:YlcG family protein [Citrobacter sedlakii]EGB2526606.1 YlcG family protein [Salmonella enterica]EIV7025269.1 YlcG family protein [Salmonella enterica]EIW3702028.1 YlcG family protein [Salmonella enterica]EJF4886033.1 YlcG family protein [Salmonella enterica]ELX2875607.1 YlcG family protein [Salmonella enterica]